MNLIVKKRFVLTFLLVAFWCCGVSAGEPRTRNTIDPRDIVVHAAGCLQFKLPLNWKLTEKTHRREIRLLITPPQAFQNNQSNRDSLWLTYHRKLNSDFTNKELQSMMITRIRSHQKSAKLLNQQNHFKIGRYHGIRQDFVLSVNQPSGHQALQGSHWLLPTDYGLLELELVSTKSRFANRLKKVSGLLDTAEFSKPQNLAQKVLPKLKAAKSIVGSWKSLGGKLQIYGDGSLTLQNDRHQISPIDQQGSRVFAQKHTVLQGKFAATKNGLQVTWKDGSRTNYSWKLVQDELFLTDHTGRVSQLRRLFE